MERRRLRASYHPAWRAGHAFFAHRPDDYATLREASIAILRRGNEAAAGFRTTSRYYLLRADLPD